MSDASAFARDPLVHAINGGIKEDIRFNLHGGRYAAVVALTLAGIDAMAYLDAPSGALDVSRDDFVAWAERYVAIVDGRLLAGLDLYGARCAVLHQYTAQSRLSREGRCRLVMWANKMQPPVKVAPDNTSAVVSITALAESFLEGVDRFMVDAFASEARRKVVEPRMRDLLQAIPYPRGE